MKTILTFLFTCFTLLSYSQTQYEMNMEAYSSFQKADSQLNRVYKKIVKMYSRDTIFINNLKKSQRLWIQFRDAEMDMMYPNYGTRYPYGSVHPMCWSYYKEGLTKERIETLMQWIRGSDETDVCSGSPLREYYIKHPEERKEYFDDLNEYIQSGKSKE